MASVIDVKGKKVVLPTVPPVEAAKELRSMVTWLKNNSQSMTAGLSANQAFAHIRHRLGFARQGLNGWKEYRGTTDVLLGQLEIAVKERRAAVGKDLISRLRFQLAKEATILNDTRSHLSRAIEHIPGDEDGSGKKFVQVPKDQFDRIYVLSQCFPTSEDVPFGREANIVRAIVAMLRANDVEGIATVTEAKGANGATTG